jgi:hypothetical protein
MTKPKPLPSQPALWMRFEYCPLTGEFTRKRNGKPTGRRTNQGYFVIVINSRLYFRHRLAWQWMYGDLDENTQIDHINRIRGDDRICNLRKATSRQNHFNKSPSKTNTSGYKGVCFELRKNRWKAQITINGKVTHLGYFFDPISASEAYVKAARRYQGEFCYVPALEPSS